MASKNFDTFIDLWRNEFAIERTINEQICVDKNGNPLPWYTYPAIEFLAQFDYKNKRIFEYGCGSSSFFWANKALEVISIEDNPNWYNLLHSQLQEKNLIIELQENQQNYISAISNKGIFDVIIIDGKNRFECTKQAIQHLSTNGFIILDDSDRVNTSQDYQNAIFSLKNAGLLQIDFYGCCPMNNFTKTTSFFLRRNFDFPIIGKYQPANGIGNLWGKPRKERKEFYKKSQSNNNTINQTS